MVCDSEGKIPYNVLKYAFDDSANGGIVRVTLNGGASDKWKVPMINEDGRLSFSVLPLASTSLEGAVTLASNTGNSSDSGKVPVCGSNGKLSSNVLPSVSGTKLTYSVMVDSSGGVYLHIAEAKNAIFGAEVKVLVVGLKVKVSDSTTVQGVNVNKVVRVYNRCYNNGDLDAEVSAYFIDSGAPVLSVPYDGNDVKILVESLSEYGESGVNYSNLAYSAAVVIEAKY